MSEQDRKPQPGDKVRVTFEGVVSDLDDHGRVAVVRTDGETGRGGYVPVSASVVVLAPETCGATEGATGVACGLLRGHSLPIDHEGTHEPDDKADSVGYRLFVRWPWNQWDRDYAEVVLPRPEPSREPRVFTADGPEPPDDVSVVLDYTAEDRPDRLRYLVRQGDRWQWNDQKVATDLVGGAGTWRQMALHAAGPLREVLS